MAFCSTRKIPTPASLMRASVRNSSVHNSGASPSEGSSSRRIVGADIIARPIATICRSPPLIVRTSCLGRSRSLGNKLRTRARLSASRSRARVGWAPRMQILLHGEIGEDAAILGHQRDAGLDDLMRRAMGDVGPVHEHRRAVHLARLPGYGPQEGALAGAIGAEHHHDLAFRHRRRNVLEGAMAAVEDRNVAALKHRRLRDRPGSRRDRPAPPPASLRRSWRRCS